MNLEKIVNKAFKEARRKISNSDLTSRCMEYNYPVGLQLRAIRENLMAMIHAYPVADIYTDLQQVRKDVQNAINHYKQNFRSAYK